MARNRKKIYKPGEQINIRISKSIDEELLNWINSRTKMGPEIFSILERYVKHQLVDLDAIANLIKMSNVEEYLSNNNLYKDIEMVNNQDKEIQKDILINGEHNKISGREVSVENIYDGKESDAKEEHMYNTPNSSNSNNDKYTIGDDFVQPKKELKRKAPLSSQPTFAIQNKAKDVFAPKE